MTASSYAAFLEERRHTPSYGFDCDTLPEFLYPFQAQLVQWALKRGRAAIFADCGLGKTPAQLVWSQEVHRREQRPVLILTPLAVSAQTLTEAQKFGIDAERSQDGSGTAPILITNYERLHHFRPADFAGVVCDESSILKCYDGKRRSQITRFLRKVPYRLLCTATAAPNDFTELGTSSEALGELGHMDMLAKFFINAEQNASMRRQFGIAKQWRFKGHAEDPFWRWVVTWARAVRKPSDLGCDDGPFVLPPLHQHEHELELDGAAEGHLFARPAVTLWEQRAERKRTIRARCEKIAALVDTDAPALVWCDLNAEGELLASLIRDAKEVAGRHSDAEKEARLLGFARGDFRVLVTKPKIGAWGLNYQHCAHVTFFPTHSYEQMYQGVRRCWRFGQTKPVTVDIVTTPGSHNVLRNLTRKADEASRMFRELVAVMQDALGLHQPIRFGHHEEVPAWL